MEAKEIIDALHWRYAVKQYDTTKKVEDDKLHTILEAGRLSPSWANTQPWKFVVISNPEVKEKLAPYAYHQPQITQSSHLIVLCAITNFDSEYVDNHVSYTASTTGTDENALQWYKDMLMGMAQNTDHWLKHNPFIALGAMTLAAAELHVDASPMGGFDRNAFDEVLGLKEKNLTSLVLLWLGYRSEEDEAGKRTKVRRPKEEVVIHID